ncbi:hypothetical protein [Pseudomonas capsici]|uniref:hypothetical protein n=1 Tax=Pseudomonas capsici TaxID=2810614 RepID=UPI0021F0A843|nr:hypothetical protein [Pseudomonas capsici]MCV4343279.1 hypothetical protein [Pseudomonas capsici]
MTHIDWSKAPAHATHWCPGNAKIEAGWIYAPGGNNGVFHSCYADKGLEHIPDFPEWRKARLVPRPAEVKWSGEGLPPVGAVCEVFDCTHDYCLRFNGQHVEILLHRTDSEGDRVAVFAADDFEYHALTEKRFRPIKTPEQIAAEERAKHIAEIAKETGLRMRDGAVAVATAIYDAGYRKQVEP